MRECTGSGIPERFGDAVFYPKRENEIWRALPADAGIVLCGSAALEHSARVLEELRAGGRCGRLPEWLPERMQALMRARREQTDAAMRIIREAGEALPETQPLFAAPLGERSLQSAFWDLAEGIRCGLRIDLRKIPVRQESVEILEAAGENLYEVPAGGQILLVGAAAQRICDRLLSEGIPAAVVGFLQPGSDKLLVSGDHLSYLNRPDTK